MSITKHRRSQTRICQRLKIIQDQVGHACASTTSIYSHVSDEYRNRLVRAALAKRGIAVEEEGRQ
jgi:integrase